MLKAVLVSVSMRAFDVERICAAVNAAQRCHEIVEQAGVRKHSLQWRPKLRRLIFDLTVQ